MLRISAAGCFAVAIATVGCDGDEADATGGSSGSAFDGGAAGTGGAGAQGTGAGGEGGVVDAGASSGSGSGGAPSERRVFVTSQTYTGALGGIAGADDACVALAGAAALGGQWKAWVGDGIDAPVTTFVQSRVPYVLVGGPTVAADWADLTDGTLAAAIDRDETGSAVDAAGNTHVWTGASTTGTPLPYHCEGWTTTTPDFTPRGLFTATDSAWVMSGPDPCATANRLYCFEQ
jgi:hypothetical protein